MSKEFISVLVIAAIFLFSEMGGDPSPGPEPGPDPRPPGKASVLIVEETSARASLPPSQLSVLLGVGLREFVMAGGGEMLVLDKDVDAQFLDEKWQNRLAKPRDSLPWLYVFGGRKEYSGPLPETIDETQKLVEGHR